MGNYKHDFGKRFKAYRLNAGLTQKETAELLGYESHVAIYKIENGRQDVSISKIPAICKIFHCNPIELLGMHDDNTPAHPEGANIMERIDRLPAAQRNALVNTVDILVKGMEQQDNGNSNMD